MNAAANTQKFNVTASLIRLFTGAVLGAGAVMLYYTYSHVLRWSDLVAIVIALVCFIGSVRLFTESFNPKTLAARLEVEGDTTPREMNAARLQALLTTALGIAIVWPVIATAQGWPAPVWAYAVTAAFIAVRIGYTLIMWRKTDEFMRQRTKNVIFWVYFMSQTGLIAYAGAERLGLVATLTAWDVMVLITATSIVSSTFMGRAKTSA